MKPELGIPVTAVRSIVVSTDKEATIVLAGTTGVVVGFSAEYFTDLDVRWQSVIQRRCTNPEAEYRARVYVEEVGEAVVMADPKVLHF